MTAKEYLWQIRNIHNDIESDKCELKELEKLGAFAQEDTLQTIYILKKKLNEEIAEYYRVKTEIREKILALPNNKYKTLLREYYINRLTLEEVAVIMDRDFDYVRHLHGWALEYFRKFYGFEKKNIKIAQNRT